MSAIKLDHVDCNYERPYNEVFKDLNLVLDTSWRTGLVGRNGTGKSTLLKLLTGSLAPTAGTVQLSERPVYFPASVNRNQSTGDVIRDACGPFRQWEIEMAQLVSHTDEASLSRYGEVQEAYQRAGGYSLDANIRQELAALDLPEQILAREFRSLSGGEQTRALIAALFVAGDTFPLIDEPTNHLDLSGRETLAAYLSGKSGFVLVSHDRAFLDSAIDHVVAINRSDVQVTQGDYSTWRQHADELERHEAHTRANIERAVKQLKRAAVARREGSNSREKEKYKSGYKPGKAPSMIDTGNVGHKAAKQMKRALAIERRMDGQLTQKQGLLRNQEKERKLIIDTRESQDALLLIQDLAFGFDGPDLFQHLSLELCRGQRLAVIGANGSGKSTLFELIAGRLIPTAGIIHKPSYVQYSRAYQRPIWQSGALREHLQEANLDETRFRQILGSFGVSGDVFERPLETFSQGQRKKVDLARSMLDSADFLLWDEPLNYIDMFSREQIEAAILESEPTMLFIEHDRRFVEHIATDVIAL